MSLIQKMLANAGVTDHTRYHVRARVLLDDAGKVKSIQIKQGSGDSAIDQRAINELKNSQYAASRLGSKTVRVWYDVTWSCPKE